MLLPKINELTLSLASLKKKKNRIQIMTSLGLKLISMYDFHLRGEGLIDD